MEDEMSIQEKRTLWSFISTTIGFIGYYYYVYQLYLDQSLNTIEEMKFWAAAILIFIPVQIVVKIIVFILVVVFSAGKSGEFEECFSDELDKLVESKASRIFSHIFLFGFLIALGSLLMNMSVFVMFTIIFFSMGVGGMIMDIAQFIYYRRGF